MHERSSPYGPCYLCGSVLLVSQWAMDPVDSPDGVAAIGAGSVHALLLITAIGLSWWKALAQTDAWLRLSLSLLAQCHSDVLQWNRPPVSHVPCLHCACSAEPPPGSRRAHARRRLLAMALLQCAFT